VVKANITIAGETFDMVKDQQLFYWEHTFTELKQYQFVVCVVDGAGNRACLEEVKTFEKLDIMEVPTSVEMPSKKVGKFAEVILFNITEKPPLPITITLEDFVCDLGENVTVNSLFRVRLIDGDGAKKNFEGVGSSVEITQAGQIKLEIRGENISEYDARLRFNLTEIYVSKQPIAITGRILDYDLPESFTQDWYGGTLDCMVVDTGDLDTSYFDCDIEYPIKSGLDEVAIPTTPREKQREEDKHTLELDNKDRVIGIFKTMFTCVFVFLGGALGLIYWNHKHQPYVKLMRDAK